MPIEIWAEILAWSLSALGALAAAAIVALVRWLRRLDRELTELRQQSAPAGEIVSIKGKLEGHTIELTRLRTDRDDLVPLVSRAIGTIERHGEALARLDERTRGKEDVHR